MGRAFGRELAFDQPIPVGQAGLGAGLGVFLGADRAVGVGAELGRLSMKHRAVRTSADTNNGCPQNPGASIMHAMSHCAVHATISEIGPTLSWNLSAFTSARCSMVSSRLLSARVVVHRA